MNYYYLDAANRPVGPLPLEEIRQKAAARQIPANLLIAAAGSSQWQPMPATGTPPAAGLPLDSLGADGAATALRTIGGVLSAGLVEDCLAASRRLGHWIVTATGALGLAYAIYAAVKSGAFESAGYGVLLVAGLACAQFAARKFFALNETLLSNAPCRVSTPALLECVALAALFGVVVGLIGAITACARIGDWQPLVPAILTTLFWALFAAIALHPESVHVDSTRGGAGEETVGLLAFFFKAILKMAPVFFLVLALFGGLIVLLSFFGWAGYVARFAPPSFVPPLRIFAAGDPGQGFYGVRLVISACLLPLISYVGFIVVSLPMDLWRALLAVPGKLDALKR